MKKSLLWYKTTSDFIRLIIKILFQFVTMFVELLPFFSGTQNEDDFEEILDLFGEENWSYISDEEEI